MIKKCIIIVFVFILGNVCSASVTTDSLGKNRKLSFANDNEFLTYIQRQYFKYVWDAALPNSGLSRVRMVAEEPDRDKYTITTGSSGFGIAGIIVGIERRFISRREGIARLEKIAGFLERSDRFHGMWPHWIDDQTGKTMPFANPTSKDNGGDVVESAFLAQGLIVARQYLLKGNKKEKALAAKYDKLWKEMEWSWYRKDNEDVVYWHWSPDYGWEKNFPLQGYNECLAVYLLGAASPTYPISKETYYKGWARNGAILSDTTVYGIKPIVAHNSGKGFVGPMFWTAFSYVGFNPKGLKDELGINYFNVSAAQARIQQAYCIANPKGYKGYGANCWGFSAGYSVKGYKAHNTKNDLGVITPSGTLAAMPFAPEAVMPALKHFYYDLGDKLWGPYGFYDAYIASEDRVVYNYLANNQCAVLPMIENYRTGLIWNLFMSAPEVSKGLKKLNFSKT
jgi:hypothetical protein